MTKVYLRQKKWNTDRGHDPLQIFGRDINDNWYDHKAPGTQRGGWSVDVDHCTEKDKPRIVVRPNRDVKTQEWKIKYIT